MSRSINKEKAELKISYTVQGEEWKNAIEKAKVELRKNVVIKGYRKGHVPANMADKLLNPFDIYDKAVNSVINKVYEEHIVKEITADDEIIGRPVLNIADLTDEKATIEVTYALFPEVKLGDYKKLSVKLDSLELKKEDLEATQHEMIKSYVALVESSEGIKEGDTVNFDFKGFINNEPFEGGEAEGYDLVIGSGQFIPGFEDQMKGLKVGEEKELKLSFPENYHAKNLAGQKTVFQVKINSVKTPSYPNVDEQFIKQLNIPNISTLEDFNKYLEIQTYKNKVSLVQNKFIESATEKLVKASKTQVSETLVKEEANKYYQNFLQNLKQQQISEKEYLEFSKNTKEEVMKNFEDQALPNLEKMFVLGAIAKAEGFKITNEDYEAECAKLAEAYGLSLEQVKSILKFENVEMNLMNEKIYNTLMESNDKAGFKKLEEIKAKIKAFDDEQTQKIVEAAKKKREQAEKKEDTK
ncbi:trigger factor [Mycoplasma struthionis]|uniref:Trigger factor n=1 Tax=Mycoplasma struthionis TaxID=538220 RepID=A0A3G8LGW7_9MOLU|nr:trigger factor [Mycoplasma struthionis]AZG68929.1 trigger factor [Mycoplasma struthionis]TPI01169.1 trigger factor [Mycoplasma struthionis]